MQCSNLSGCLAAQDNMRDSGHFYKSNPTNLCAANSRFHYTQKQSNEDEEVARTSQIN